MSVALASVHAVVAGRQPTDFALLQNARLEGFGTRAFGREPILGLFARAPITFSEAAEVQETPRGLMVVEGENAVFADLHDNRIVRLWALGELRLGAPEPAISVARDLDLSQAEGDLVFDSADHAELGFEDAASLRVVGESLARPASWSDGPTGPEVFSNRVFVIRALSASGQVAALLVLAGALDSRRRKPFSMNAALTFKTNGGQARDIKLVVDHAGLAQCREAEWTPRL